ncbi:MAG: endonuclease/exonuclease/phosphatase family protein [Spirochaetales bacterium]|nr:endonuclease/exonuclease/phosphatase family protein [Spirochaetales bacterium]
MNIHSRIERWAACVALAYGCLIGCTVFIPDDGRLTVVAYNVENLFDAEVRGTEYEEFLPESGWDEHDVDERLYALGKALRDLESPPDVLVISEIETGELLHRLLDEHVPDFSLPYRAFGSGSLNATGVAIASRFPIREVRSLLPRSGEHPPLRPILEARLHLTHTDLIVFANHWKSKRGGAAATEPLRRAAAALLQARLDEIASSEPELPILVAGDLNVRPRESEYLGDAYSTALLHAERLLEWFSVPSTAPEWFEPRYFTPSADRVLQFLVLETDAERLSERERQLETVVLYDPWAGSTAKGSYWYVDRWERIDHIFANRAAVDGDWLYFIEFAAATSDVITDSSGRPMSWEDGGVSDHLPVVLQLGMHGKTE